MNQNKHNPVDPAVSQETEAFSLKPFKEPDREALRSYLAPIVGEIRLQWHNRQAWHRSEKRWVLQAQSLCRSIQRGTKEESKALYLKVCRLFKKGWRPESGDNSLEALAFGAIAPLLAGLGKLVPDRVAVEKRLDVIGQKLPGLRFVSRTYGLTVFTLYSIVGEAPGVHLMGLSDFATVSKLWKRMGLAVMPDGKRQRKSKDIKSALEMGYSPARRSVIWTIGSSLIKKGIKSDYYLLYIRYKEEEKAKLAEKGIKVVAGGKGKIPAGCTDKMSLKQVDSRAKRKMEKQLLIDLYVEWNREVREWLELWKDGKGPLVDGVRLEEVDVALGIPDEEEGYVVDPMA